MTGWLLLLAGPPLDTTTSSRHLSSWPRGMTISSRACMCADERRRSHRTPPLCPRLPSAVAATARQRERAGLVVQNGSVAQRQREAAHARRAFREVCHRDGNKYRGPPHHCVLVRGQAFRSKGCANTMNLVFLTIYNRDKRGRCCYAIPVGRRSELTSRLADWLR
jgi:hypothetical protein